jgi:hypothetical protein
VPDILVSGKNGEGNGMIDALIGTELLKKLQNEAMKETTPKKKEDTTDKRSE